MYRFVTYLTTIAAKSKNKVTMGSDEINSHESNMIDDDFMHEPERLFFAKSLNCSIFVYNDYK